MEITKEALIHLILLGYKEGYKTAKEMLIQCEDSLLIDRVKEDFSMMIDNQLKSK